MSQPKRCSLRKVSIDQALVDMPAIEIFDPKDLPEIDILIAAKGFEERVLEIPRRLMKSGRLSQGVRVVLGSYQTNKDDNDRRFLELAEGIAGACPNIQFFDADYPENAIGQLEALLSGHASSTNLLFDVSGASTTLIFSVVSALARHFGGNVFVTYASAEKYYPDEGNDSFGAEHRHSLSFTSESPKDSGTSEAAVHPAFRGVQQDSQPVHLLAVPGVGSDDRFKRSVAYIAEDVGADLSDAITLVLPFTEAPEHKFRNELLAEYVSQQFVGVTASDKGETGGLAIVRCDYLDYRHMARVVLETAEKRLGQNVWLIHLGTKMQSLGGALALCARSEVGLAFARPKAFDATHYSSGVGACSLVRLGNVRSLVGEIASAGTLRVHRDEASPDEKRFGSD
jgi:hypothetical protein